MKKKVGIPMMFVLIIAVGAVLFLNRGLLLSGDKSNGASGKASDSPIQQIMEGAEQPVEQEFPDTMTEYNVQEAIHAMSHQKVKADDKWLSILMTPERIDRLIEIVENKQDRFQKNSELYLEILTKWSNDDFSQVDQDHNAIWKLQKGTIGRATGILSAEEEQKFIKKKFDVTEE